MRDLLVNGVPLRDPLGNWTPDYTRSSLFGSVSRATPTTEQIGYHGVDSSGPSFFGSAQYSLVLNLQAADKDEYNTLFRALQALFGGPSYQLVSAPQRSSLVNKPSGSPRSDRTFNVDPDDLQVATARTIGSIAVERLTERAARLTIVIELPGGFWQSQNNYSLGSTPLPQGTTTIDLTSSGLAGESTAPITEGLIRVRGVLAQGSALQIRDRGLADRALVIRPAVALQVNQYILVDPRTLNARLLTTNTWSLTAGSDARSLIELTGNGGFTFEPQLGFDDFPSTPNRYWATVVKTDSVAAQIEMQLRRSYLS